MSQFIGYLIDGFNPDKALEEWARGSASTWKRHQRRCRNYREGRAAS